jgi:hypothetical protein
MGVVARFADVVLGRPGLGYRPDPTDERDQPLGALALSGDLPITVSHRALVSTVLNQGSTKSCVGHSLAAGLELALRLDGAPAFAVSPWAVWFWARAAEGEEKLDDGTHIRTAMKQVQGLGIPPESLWGRTPKRARPPHDKAPPFACLRAAAKYRGLRGYYRIGSGDTTGIRRALAAGKPVVFGMDVSRTFTQPLGPLVIGDDPDDSIGGHAMCCVGYRAVDGKDCFEILNSWGKKWRSDGFAFVTERRMAQARDVWALDVFRGSVTT